MIRRIGLLGGPGCGKTTTGHLLFGKLKSKRYNVEYVPELSIKKSAYKKEPILPWRQWDIFSEQLSEEEFFLTHNCDAVITEAPLALSLCYASKDKQGYADLIFEAMKDFDHQYPTVNIFIERDPKTYTEIGRYQNLEQAQEMDEYIKKFLKTKHLHYKSFSVNDLMGIVEYSKWTLGLKGKKK